MQITIDKKLDVPAQMVWDLLADFGNVSWLAGISKVESEGDGVGMIRHIHIGDMPPVVERLDELDPESMRLDYSIVKGNLPVDNLRGSATVEPMAEDRCKITWHIDFKAQENITEVQAEQLLSGIYTGILESLGRHLTAN